MSASLATIASTITMTAEEAAALRFCTVVMPCGGLLHMDYAEYGPEQGEVSLHSGTERYILPTGRPVEVACWDEGR